MCTCSFFLTSFNSSLFYFAVIQASRNSIIDDAHCHTCSSKDHDPTARLLYSTILRDLPFSRTFHLPLRLIVRERCSHELFIVLCSQCASFNFHLRHRALDTCHIWHAVAVSSHSQQSGKIFPSLNFMPRGQSMFPSTASTGSTCSRPVRPPRRFFANLPPTEYSGAHSIHGDEAACRNRVRVFISSAFPVLSAQWPGWGILKSFCRFQFATQKFRKFLALVLFKRLLSSSMKSSFLARCLQFSGGHAHTWNFVSTHCRAVLADFLKTVKSVNSNLLHKGQLPRTIGNIPLFWEASVRLDRRMRCRGKDKFCGGSFKDRVKN